MKKILSFILLSALTPAAFSVEAAAAEKPVVAQFAAYYSGKDARLPDPNLVTHIIFAPARINADFSLQIPAENMLGKVAALKAKNPDFENNPLDWRREERKFQRGGFDKGKSRQIARLV